MKKNALHHRLSSALLVAALLVTALLLVFSKTNGQGTEIPLGEYSYRIVDRFNILYGKILPNAHTGIRPYSRRVIGQMADSLSRSNLTGTSAFDYNLGYLLRENSEWTGHEFLSKQAVLKYFYRDQTNLYAVEKAHFILKINPVFNYEMGKEFGESPHRFINSRGAEFRAYIKKKLGIYSFVTDNQYRMMSYAMDRIEAHEAVPNEGYYKDFKGTGVDFFTARGYITVNALEHIDISLGHGKHFIGNGFRSLLLSDFSDNYFYLKLNTRIWKIHYQNLFTELTHQYDRGLDTLLDKKYAAFHYLSISLAHWLDVGLFETVVYGRQKLFELQYLNPIIFYRSIEQELGSPDNVIVGLDAKANIASRMQFYLQFVLDEFSFTELRKRTGWWANKFGLQLGLKYLNVAGIDHLDAQLEYNMLRPYTYTHGLGYQNYTHYNQPLAHPLGANLREYILLLRYQLWQKLELRLKSIYTIQGRDTAGTNFGSDIFISFARPDGSLNTASEFGNKIGQGIKTRIVHAQLVAAYQIRHNIFFDLNLHLRHLNSALDERDDLDAYLGAGLRLNLARRTFDF